MPNLIESSSRWNSLAECKKQEVPLEHFFSIYEKNAIIAKRTDAICADCPVKERCLEWAVNNQATGLHGEVYLSLGKYAQSKNRHKTPEDAIRLKAKVESLNVLAKARTKSETN